ncbi:MULTISPECIES: TRAP transporter small permease subunit [Thalassospira]|jgi:C4-dicarboxylate transporter, DctQ subunit|uniref:TRAP transporter small permease protein n=1 Tax=Thalassospira profundimaris TaxID=502049 RepID=A0A367V4T5_9PROT|nr:MULTISPECIES: TRAP transporter small permease [Thalassospira]MBR9902267.1 TRAP transporter small permease [Rhodospirillales bacterium]HAI31880.1 TRAP transporter small permease [Thalassospira sp.]KZB73362.1 C4-dicarboxylate ABC transporter permease [Thalassospira sp. MCCC 1A01148]MBS8275525.1 TRAP transporter small permease [Thalassospira tepidiphila]RCK20197.1 C4-dicarboxylate ABC transporter permease [Thalassospira profundimaris]|tara:strand:- start:1467 stop:2060 length:594 start_codon:yes stop_codon:yes gene_type:complete
MSETPQHLPLPEPEEVQEQPLVVSGLLGRLITKTSNVFALGFLLSMATLIYEIVMRHVFNSPTLWAHETTTFICAIGFVFGGLFCAARDKHIRVVILYDIVGPKMRKTLDVFISVVCMISSGFFAWAAWLMVERAAFTPTGDIHLETTGSAFNAPYPGVLKVFLFLTLIVLTVQFLVQAINYARKAPIMPASHTLSD